MNLVTCFYYANYEIIKFGNKKFIHCCKSEKDLEMEYRFQTKKDIKNLIKSILNLNLENEKDIVEFTTQYGLLINTQNNPDYPTYCGKPVPQKINELISPSTNGFSMSLDLFKYCINLIKNILHLSTEIRLYADYKKNANTSTNAKLDYKNNILNIVNYFFSLLYQPYATITTMIDGINLVLDGSSPLSRFAYNYHEALIGFLIPRPTSPIYQYNHSLLSLCKKNKDLQQQFYSLDNDKNITSEADIPSLKLADDLKMTYSISKDDYENFILSDEFYQASPMERKISISSIRKPLKKHFEQSAMNYVQLNITHSIAPNIKYANELITPASDTIYYEEILNILIESEKYFHLGCNNPSQFEVRLNNDVKLTDTLSIMKKINNIAQKLIVETINSFTENINHKLYVDEKGQYNVNFISESFLQNIFLMMSDILNTYNVTVCKYRYCNNPVFSLKSRPAQCCCHNHLTSYSRYKQRHSE